MVLAPQLTEAEVRRHKELIQEYCVQMMNTPEPEIDFINNGVKKGVYRVACKDRLVVAAAANRDPFEDEGPVDTLGGRFVEEYGLLRFLHDRAADRFPRAISHYAGHRADLGELIIMEYLPHLDIDSFRRQHITDVKFNRRLAFEIGYAVAEVQLATDHYSSEPHNGNILIRCPDDPDVKFCDAIQFLPGSLEDAARSILAMKDERRECFNFIHCFRDGMSSALVDYTRIPKEEADQSLNFLRKYNPIF